jgi:hypothetical protein
MRREPRSPTGCQATVLRCRNDPQPVFIRVDSRPVSIRVIRGPCLIHVIRGPVSIRVPNGTTSRSNSLLGGGSLINVS